MSDEIVLYPTNRKVNDAGEVLIPNLNALEQRVKELEAKLAEVESERQQDESRNEEHWQAAMAMSEKHRKNWVEACQSRDRLREALRCLVDQVDKSEAIDSHGHQLRNLQALHVAKQALKEER